MAQNIRKWIAGPFHSPPRKPPATAIHQMREIVSTKSADEVAPGKLKSLLEAG